jgi:hypothetical protein
MKVAVRYGKVRGFRPQWEDEQWGVSNNRGGEVKRGYVEEAVKRNGRQCRGLQTYLRLMKGE